MCFVVSTINLCFHKHRVLTLTQCEWILYEISQILYESVMDSLTDGHGSFTVLVCPLEEEWKW